MTVADRTLTPAAGADGSAGFDGSATVGRLRLLARATAEVTAAPTIDEALDRLVRLLVPLVADGAVIHLVDAPAAAADGSLTVVRVAAAGHRWDDDAERSVVADQGPLAHALRAGRLLVRDLAAVTSHPPGSLHTLVVSPIIVMGEVSGALSVVAGGRRPAYDEGDLLLVQELAARAAVAVQQAHLDARARETTLSLQRSLLPQRPVVLDQGDSVSRYVPGAAGAEVGGDWHDVLDLGAGRVAFVIGDVMGRGLHAAALMGQVRTAVRAYARQHLPPSEMLRLLDGLVADLGDAHLATCVYAVHDPADNSLTIARAGHVPPLVRRSGGVVEVVDGEPGPPLGIGGGVFPEHRLVLADDSVLVLCTDGLVESGQLDVDRGIRELREAMREQPDDLDAYADGLLTRLGALAGQDDDVALLVVRLAATGHDRAAALELTLGPRSVAHAREFAGMHAERLAIPSERLGTVQLIVSELATNSLLHGERPVRLRLRRTPTRLVIEVSDAGHRAPQPRRAREDEEGGRGLHLVASMSHRWGVRPTPGGKVVWAEVLLPRA